MDWRNRVGLYGSYFLGMAGIGFTLPYLPLFLQHQGLSDRAIGLISTLAALAGLIQIPLGIWSDRVGSRKPFLISSLIVLTLATLMLYGAQGLIWLSILVMLFAENGACRATLESLSGAEAAHLAPPGHVGAALGALRFWKPLAIVMVALMGGIIAERWSVEAILYPLAAVQALAVFAAFFIHEGAPAPHPEHEAVPSDPAASTEQSEALSKRAFDPHLWLFVAAMVLFHLANAPTGVYLGLFLKRDLLAPDRFLSYAFVVSMIAWMLVVKVTGNWADRFGRRPLLIAGWSIMTVRLGLIALATAPWQVLLIQLLDGTAQAMFAVVAAAWVTDRMADPRRVGQAQVLVGSSLVSGSALGPILAALVVEPLGYRGMFWVLTLVGLLATAIVVPFIPESLHACDAGKNERHSGNATRE